MKPITKEDKERIKGFISKNELFFKIVDLEDGISKFRIISDEGINFFFNTYNNKYILIKYDPDKDKDNQIFINAYEYYEFKTMIEMLTQLKYYDDNIPKSFWEVTNNSAEIPFHSDSYVDNWYKDFQRDAEYTKIDSDYFDNYKYIVYDNPNYSPCIKTPQNTLSQISYINTEEQSIIKVNKLYYEIHPISCKEGEEKYLFKLLANNEDVLKEFINYIVSRKKGLSLLIDDIFNNLSKN